MIIVIEGVFMSTNVHEGHRERLKNRLLKQGNFENFEPHNILELLLFYSVPRKDTNEIAHELLKRFGSINQVFSADFEELITVKGVGAHTATLIKMIAPLCSVYFNEKTEDKVTFNSRSQMHEFFVSKYIAVTIEKIYVLCVDSSNKVIDGKFLFEGSVHSSTIDTRILIDYVLKNKAAGVIIAHNHPCGEAKISNDDVIATTYVKNALKLVGVQLIDHVIISNNESCFFSMQGYL